MPCVLTAERTKKSDEKTNSRTPSRRHRQPVLRFTPAAWAKLLFLRDAGDTEVGGFGISHATDLLLVEDVRLVRQACTTVTVKFDDASVADFLDEQVDLGRRPQQCGRIWVHTHPGSSATPSWTDEQTFSRCFGPSDWAVMFILAQHGQASARLRFNVGPGGTSEIPVEVDYSAPFSGSDREAWQREYSDNVTVPESRTAVPRSMELWGDNPLLRAWDEFREFGEDVIR